MTMFLVSIIAVSDVINTAYFHLSLFYFPSHQNKRAHKTMHYERLISSCMYRKCTFFEYKWNMFYG